MASIVTAVGRTWISELIVGLRSSVDMYIGWGTGGTETTMYDTTLEIEQDRKLATASQSVGNARLNLWEATFDMADVIDQGLPFDEQWITPAEFALFDDSSEGNMLFRRDTASVPLHSVHDMDVDIILSVHYYVGGSADWMDGLITDAGVTALSAMLLNTSYVSPFTFMGFGTGTAAEAAGNTALTTQVERVASGYEFISRASPNDTIRYWGQFSPVSSTKVISEIGIFNALTGGTLLWRDLLSSTITIPAGIAPLLFVDLTIASDAP